MLAVRRGLGSAAIATVAVAGLVLTAHAASAAPPAPPGQLARATLQLDPPTGAADTSITATFHVQLASGGNDCHLTTTYRWDGHLLDQHSTDACTSHHTFQPLPGDREPGAHQVVAEDTVTGTTAVTTFTITTTGTPSLQPSTTTQAGTGAANAQTMVKDQGTDAGAAPAVPAVPATSPANVVAHGTIATAASRFTLSSWLIGFGSALGLAGLTIAVIMAAWGRRGNAEFLDDGYGVAPAGVQPDLRDYSEDLTTHASAAAGRLEPTGRYP